VAWGVVLQSSHIPEHCYGELLKPDDGTGVIFEQNIDDGDRCVMYIEKSDIETERFYGVIAMGDIPPEKEDWTQKITEVCNQFGISLDDSIKFGWFFCRY